jgi:hypothetical protein
VRNETMIKFLFGRQADAATHRRQIDRLRREALAAASHLGELRALLEANASEPDAPYWLITLRFGEIQNQAQLQWLDEALAVFDELEKGEKKRATRRRRGS